MGKDRPGKQSTQIVVTDEDREFAGRVTDTLQRAQQGQAEALVELGVLFDQHPGLWQNLYNLTANTQQKLLRWCGPALGEAARRQAEQMREELLRDGNTPLERVLVDRVVMCWLRVQQAEVAKTTSDESGVDLRRPMVWERRLEMAHKNLLGACKTLAQVRRLQHPPLPRPRVGGQPVDLKGVVCECKKALGRDSEKHLAMKILTALCTPDRR